MCLQTLYWQDTERQRRARANCTHQHCVSESAFLVAAAHHISPVYLSRKRANSAIFTFKNDQIIGIVQKTNL